MGDNTAGEDDIVFAVLADQVGEVQDGVDADRGEFCAGVDTGRELERGEDSELSACQFCRRS